jgi:hypothetical protein
LVIASQMKGSSAKVSDQKWPVNAPKASSISAGTRIGKWYEGMGAPKIGFY